MPRPKLDPREIFVKPLRESLMDAPRKKNHQTGWWFHSIPFEIIWVKMGPSSTRFGVKIEKNNWNHHHLANISGTGYLFIMEESSPIVEPLYYDQSGHHKKKEWLNQVMDIFEPPKPPLECPPKSSQKTATAAAASLSWWSLKQNQCHHCQYTSILNCISINIQLSSLYQYSDLHNTRPSKANDFVPLAKLNWNAKLEGANIIPIEDTLPETNSSPLKIIKNRPIQKDLFLPTMDFRGHGTFREAIWCI